MSRKHQINQIIHRLTLIILSLLLYIPAIQSFGVDSAFLIEVLGESSFADADPSRMTVRPKNDWKKVVISEKPYNM